MILSTLRFGGDVDALPGQCDSVVGFDFVVFLQIRFGDGCRNFAGTRLAQRVSMKSMNTTGTGSLSKTFHHELVNSASCHKYSRTQLIIISRTAGSASRREYSRIRLMMKDIPSWVNRFSKYLSLYFTFSTILSKYLSKFLFLYFTLFYYYFVQVFVMTNQANQSLMKLSS